jgi:hypothetical protein
MLTFRETKTMQKIHQLIEEIKDLRTDVSHRSALRVFSLLENNQKLFLEKMDPMDFNFLLKSFEEISNSRSVDYGTPRYKSDYQKNFELLLFHFSKII